MEDEEVRALVQSAVDQTMGCVTALTFVMRAMQAQPGFDYRVFQQHLGALLAGSEIEPDLLNPIQRAAFEAIARQFDAPLKRAAPPAPGG